MVASQIAEVLINATNQSMDSWDQSPAGSIMEEHLINWLRQKQAMAKAHQACSLLVVLNLT